MQEIEKHHIIRLSICNNIKLYVANILNRLCCSCCWKKKEKFQRLYEMGQEKVDGQLDMMKLIQNLAKLKIVLKNSLMSPEIVCQMQHSAKFLIDIDNLSSESDVSHNHTPQIDDLKNDEAIILNKDQLVNIDPYCDTREITSNPKDILKNINKDITRIQRKKVAEKKATMLQGIINELKTKEPDELGMSLNKVKDVGPNTGDRTTAVIKIQNLVRRVQAKRRV